MIVQAVLEQTWRLDEDGTYIVLMQSTEHAKAPQQPSSLLNWYRPVRAEVRCWLLGFATGRHEYSFSGLVAA